MFGKKKEEYGKAIFLQGLLICEINGADKLPNLDFNLFNRKDLTDAYVTLDTYREGHSTCRLAKTRVIDDDLNPRWEEKFEIEMCHKCDTLRFEVKDRDPVRNDRIGSVAFGAVELVKGGTIKGWFPLEGNFHRKRGKLEISLRFERAGEEELASMEVPRCMFPSREGCAVKLYQDAHAPAVPPLTDIMTGMGLPYTPPCLFEDMANALLHARKLIYIVGWSLITELHLTRDPHAHHVGEILKKKAAEGVRVLLMLWDEALSSDMYPPGVMGVGDEQTRIYFENTGVEVLLAKREKAKNKLLQTMYFTTIYTHHQKCFITDTHIPGHDDTHNRRLVAFLGGFDFTTGRWDTPQHDLFRTLHKEHLGDFYCKPMPSAQHNTGPRLPWHDIHMYVEGVVVNDVLDNFHRRWLKQAQPHQKNKLLNITERDFDLEWNPTHHYYWNVQFFRSINQDSIDFPDEASPFLKGRKGRIYDDSVLKAYTHHIRRAKKFIYIENQYFIGSSHEWKNPNLKSPHNIPIEIAARIIKAIYQKEDFRVYIVIPLHSEGNPNGTASQEILNWQYCTMEMMYRKISKALKKARSDAHPADYLSFFCLGKCEKPEDIPQTLQLPTNNTPARKARDNRRMMIYVHAKLAIFDDEYIIIGSANINERSMSGNRDTEMALGAYQPHYTTHKPPSEPNDGDIKIFRQSLWAEHCGAHLLHHNHPSTLECMNAMKNLARDNLQNYSLADPLPNNSHLLLYPLSVTQDGHLKEYPGWSEFLDEGGSVMGKDSYFLPNSLTT